MDELALLQGAAQAVEAATGLKITSMPLSYGPDTVVVVAFPSGQVSYLSEHKSHITGEAHLSLIRQQLAMRENEMRPLLVTHHLTAKQIDHCREIDLDFIDSGGNCLLRARPLWVLVRGNRPSTSIISSPPLKGGTSYASLRVIYALLCRPELLAAPYREVAAAAGVSLGVIPPVFADLEHRGLLSQRGREKGRHLLDIERTQNEWATNYPNRLRPRLKHRRFTAPSQEWWREADIGPKALWGSEVAAYRLTHYLTPVTQTIYLADDADAMPSLLRNHRLRADPHGPIEIVERFWHFSDAFEHTKGVVNPLLIYADLLTLQDSRANETAARLRKEYLNAQAKE
ncbi:type IV toxin-antitoxin system AbiEi family antitoxin [Luteibacter sp. CQ10]|uniref:type IV toxin-antitoxin system AbiEi family antitoxin n=1 Tax=Luteibacter sp. CQ10 TaxID=2805821 RepID=UPI0034A51174